MIIIVLIKIIIKQTIRNTHKQENWMLQKTLPLAQTPNKQQQSELYAPTLRKKSSDPVYITSQLIYNHSKQHVVSKDDEPPSFLKQSLNNTQQKIKHGDLQGNMGAQMQKLVKISDKVYRDALKRGIVIKQLIRNKNLWDITNNINNSNKINRSQNVKTIKLKDILDHQQQTNKCMFTAAQRKVTLEEDEYRNFEVDQNLNYVRMYNMIEEVEEGVETDRNNNKQQQQQRQNYKQQEQYHSNKSLVSPQLSSVWRNKKNIKYEHQLSQGIEHDQGLISTINGIQSKDFWLSSEQLQTTDKDKKLAQLLFFNNQSTQKKNKKHVNNTNNEKTTRKFVFKLNDIKSGSHNYIRSPIQSMNMTISNSQVIKTNTNNNLLFPVTKNDNMHIHTHSSNNMHTQKSIPSRVDSHCHSPRGVYQQILSEYSTAKLLAINKQYKNISKQQNKTSRRSHRASVDVRNGSIPIVNNKKLQF